MEPEPAPPEPPESLRDVTYVLLLGEDRTVRKVTGRTDSIMVLAFRHRDGKVGAFSVPRDLWVTIPDLGLEGDEFPKPGRVNAVVRIGDRRLGEGEGVDVLKRVLRAELGVEIRHHAMIDTEAFKALIDEVGGVRVNVQCPIQDCMWGADRSEGCAMLDLDAGLQSLDGATALHYVRSRHGTGDRDRTRRQQAVMVGLARKVRARGLRGLRKLWAVAEPHVRTDLDVESAAYYATFALDNDLADLHGFQIRYPMVRKHVTEDRKHVLALDREAFDTRLEGLFEAKLPALKKRTRCPAPDAAFTYKSKRPTSEGDGHQTSTAPTSDVRSVETLRPQVH